ncbi:MAG TPA: PPC domain-containing protein, partial [Allocoleopsis sp.]
AISPDLIQSFLVAIKKGDIAKDPAKRGTNNVQILPTDGKIVTGKLKKGDNLLPDNSYYHTYVFEGKAGQKVTIEMNSNQFDPTLLLRCQHDILIERNDDISSDNFNARIVIILPEDGEFSIFANASRPGESGEYTLRLTVEQ